MAAPDRKPLEMKATATLWPSQAFVHAFAFARQVFDVTGAGNTVIAALALAVVGGFSLPEARVFGNVAAAGVVVGKVGCVPWTRGELLEYMQARTVALGSFFPTICQ